MASDLRIRMNSSVDPAQLLADTQACLQTLLGTGNDFGLQFAHPFPAAEQQHDFATTIHSTLYPDDMAELTMLYIESVPGYEAPEEEGWQTFITIRAALDNPLKYALAAALAISLANTQNDPNVYDDEQRWNPQSRVSTGDLLQYLRVKDSPGTLPVALKKFYEQLNTR